MCVTYSWTAEIFMPTSLAEARPAARSLCTKDACLSSLTMGCGSSKPEIGKSIMVDGKVYHLAYVNTDDPSYGTKYVEGPPPQAQKKRAGFSFRYTSNRYTSNRRTDNRATDNR